MPTERRGPWRGAARRLHADRHFARGEAMGQQPAEHDAAGDAEMNVAGRVVAAIQ